MLEFTNISEVINIPQNFKITFPGKPLPINWTEQFGYLTGNLNATHIRPPNYKGLFDEPIRHGISLLALAEPHIFEVVQFKEPTEIIAQGYDSIRYLKPVFINDAISFKFSIMDKPIIKQKMRAKCKWLIRGFNQNNQLVVVAEWIVLYCAINSVR